MPNGSSRSSNKDEPTAIWTKAIQCRISLYFDVHIDKAIAAQLSLRQVSVLRSQEGGTATCRDEELLERATSLGRVLFTHDIRFRVLAESWQASGKPFRGMIFGNHQGASIGEIISDVELLAQGTEADEWLSRIEWIPLQ